MISSSGYGNAALALVRCPEVLEVARIDVLDRQDDQYIGGTKLMIDDGSIADERTEPEITLDQRRQTFERGLGIDGLARHAIHRHVQTVVRPHPPFRRCQTLVVQETERGGVLVRIGALKTRATEHDVDAVLANICPKPVPEQFDRALVAVRLEHARPPQFHKRILRRTLIDQFRDIVL